MGEVAVADIVVAVNVTARVLNPYLDVPQEKRLRPSSFAMSGDIQAIHRRANPIDFVLCAAAAEKETCYRRICFVCVKLDCPAESKGFDLDSLLNDATEDLDELNARGWYSDFFGFHGAFPSSMEVEMKFSLWGRLLPGTSKQSEKLSRFFENVNLLTYFKFSIIFSLRIFVSDLFAWCGPR